MGSTRVEFFGAIRRDARREELSIRQHSHRRSPARGPARSAPPDGAGSVGVAGPAAAEPPGAPAPKLDPVKPLIDAMLREDLTAPRKQQHTARRVLARLVDEHGCEVTYSTVRDYVARRRPEIPEAAGRLLAEAFVPQSHQPAAEAEVDFADLWIDLAGARSKVFLFTFRMSCSGKSVQRAFATQGQEAFLAGHVEAFTVLGGVPTVHIFATTI